MLTFLEGEGSDKQLRMFAVACCRALSHLLTDDRSRRAVDVAEQFASGAAEEAELKEAYVAGEAAASAILETLDETAYQAALAAAWAAVEPAYCSPAYSASHAAFYARQAGGDSQLDVQEVILDELFNHQEEKESGTESA
jgi:hypothetical protein